MDLDPACKTEGQKARPLGASPRSLVDSLKVLEARLPVLPFSPPHGGSLPPALRLALPSPKDQGPLHQPRRPHTFIAATATVPAQFSTLPPPCVLPGLTFVGYLEVPLTAQDLGATSSDFPSTASAVFFHYGVTTQLQNPLCKGRRALFHCARCNVGAGADWQSKATSAHSLSCALTHSIVCRGVAQLLHFKPSYCPHPRCSEPWKKWRTIKAYHAHIAMCRPAVPAAAPPDAAARLPAEAASSAVAARLAPLDEIDDAFIDGLKHQLAEKDAAVLKLQQQTSSLEQAAREAVKLKQQLAANAAEVSQLQQRAAALQEEAQQARQKAELQQQLVADLQKSAADKDVLNSKKEKRKSVSPDSSDSDADSDLLSESHHSQSKKPKVEGELWMRDVQPLDESVQGGLAEVGVGVLYVPSTKLPMGKERKPKLRVCLYKQTFAHSGNLYMVQSELLALQRLQRLASPWFPHFVGELNILMPTTENKQQERVVRGVGMEFIPGITVSRLLKPNNKHPSFLCMSSVNARLQLCIQLVRGMQQLHEARIVHRDIKPANLIVTSPDIYRHLVESKLLPELILRMRLQNWIDQGSSKNLKPSSAGYRLHSAIVSPKEANSVLFVNRFCTPGASSSDPGPPPQPMDVAGARLSILDLNTCDVLPQDSAVPPKYTSPFGTCLFQWRNWFSNTQCFKINKCKDASEGFDFDAFAVGIVIMDLLRTISVERVPCLESAKTPSAQYPFIKQSFTPFCDDLFSRSSAPSSAEGIDVPSLALFFRDAVLDPAVWTAGFVAANVQLSSLFAAHPPLFLLLHNMTRLRFSPSRQDELRIQPIPSMAHTAATLTALLVGLGPVAN